MLNILLFVHIIISILLIFAILLQKSGATGILTGNNTGLVTTTSATKFLTKTTIVFAAIFMINSLILANLSTKNNNNIIIEKIEKEQSTIPVAK